MSGEAAAALWGAAITALAAVLVFGLERYLAWLRERRERRRAEFERILSSSREFVIDTIMTPGPKSMVGTSLLAPGITLRLNLPESSDDTIYWLEMLVQRMLLIGREVPADEDQDAMRARQLEATLTLLGDGLVNIHRGTYDRMSTANSFIGLLNEIELRDRKTFPEGTPWWADELPEWLEPTEPSSRAHLLARGSSRWIKHRLQWRRKKKMEDLLHSVREASERLREGYDKRERLISDLEKDLADLDTAYEREKEEILSDLTEEEREGLREHIKKIESSPDE